MSDAPAASLVVQACARAREPERAAAHLSELQSEASARDAPLGTAVTTQLVGALARGGEGCLAQARALHERVASDGRPVAPPASMTLTTQLIRNQRHVEAARTLLEMAMPSQAQAWTLGLVEQRHRALSGMVPLLGDPAHAAELAELLERVALRFGLSPTADDEHEQDTF